MSKRKRPSDNDMSIIDMAQKQGLTLMTDQKQVDISDWLPTGIPHVDRNAPNAFSRICEMYGKNASGKCQTPESVVLTDSGYKTLYEVFEEAGHPITKTTKTVTPNKPIRLINRYGRPEEVSHLHFNGERKILKIETSRGIMQQVTLNHPLMVLRDNVHQWVEAEEIIEGDYLVSRIGDKAFGNDTTVKEEEAYIWGLLIADASISEDDGINYSSGDEYRINVIKEYFEELGGEPRKIVQGDSPKDMSIKLRSNLSSEIVGKVGANYGLAKDKNIPRRIKNAPEELVKAFLAGYLESDGHMGKDNFEVVSASKTLLEDIQLILMNLGIVATLKDKHAKNYPDNDYYRLFVMGDSYYKLLEEIPFRIERNIIDEKLEYLNSRAFSSSNIIPEVANLLRAYYKSTEPSERSREVYKLVPGGKSGVSRKNALRLVDIIEGDPITKMKIRELASEEFIYDEVISIKDGGMRYTYDVTLPETHSFISSGVINHNSVYATYMIKQAQMYDVPVVLIDVEGTSSRENMETLGVDPDKLFHVQPPKGEDAITVEGVTDSMVQIVETFKDVDVPVLVVWDSLGNTPAKRMLEKNYNPNSMGVKSQAITHMMTVLSQAIGHTNILFLIVNQARDDLSNPMFPSIKSTGGNALHHAASTRFEVQRASQIKGPVLDPISQTMKEEYIGHIFRVKTIKSKMTPPNRQAEMYLMSEPFKGIDFYENLVRSSIEQYKLIGKGGGWRPYDPEVGERVTMREAEWVDFVGSEEGHVIALELFVKQMERNFPENFAALDNKSFDITVNPFYAEMALFYKDKIYPTERYKEKAPTGKTAYKNVK